MVAGSEMSSRYATIKEAVDLLNSEVAQTPAAVAPWEPRVTRSALRKYAGGIGATELLRCVDSSSLPDDALQLNIPGTFANVFSNGIDHATNPDEQGEGPWGSSLSHLGTLWRSDDWVFNRRLRLGDELRARIYSVDAKALADAPTRVLVHRFGIDYRAPDGEIVCQVVRSTHRFMRADEAAVLNTEGRAVPHRWTEGELAAVAAQYRRELEDEASGAIEGGGPWPPQVGTAIPPSVRGPMTITNMVSWLLGVGTRLAPANRIAFAQLSSRPSDSISDPRWPGPFDSINAFHWDPVLAGIQGLPAPYDFGGQRIDWLTHYLTSWVGSRGRVIGIKVGLTSPNFIGDVSWITGRVDTVRMIPNGVRQARCTLTSTNQANLVNARGTGLVEWDDVTSNYDGRNMT